MYPRFTKLQNKKIFVLHSAATQAVRKLDDNKKGPFKEITTTFKCCFFGVCTSMARSRCQWGRLKFERTTQNLHKLLDVLAKTATEADR